MEHEEIKRPEIVNLIIENNEYICQVSFRLYCITGRNSKNLPEEDKQNIEVMFQQSIL